MEYTVQDLATLAGVTVRALHHYDQLGILKPSRVGENGYRYYGEEELLILQQIMFFREMQIPLSQIRKILTAKDFDLISMLRTHEEALQVGKSRIEKLINTVQNTINKLEKGESMDTNNLYYGFSKEEQKKYEQEAKERWGNTNAYKESIRRVKALGKEGMAEVMLEGKKIEAGLAKVMDRPVDSKEVQELVARHRAHIGQFYTVSDEIYAGLARMYIEDPRFAVHYDKVKPGLADFLSRAMLASLK